MRTVSRSTKEAAGLFKKIGRDFWRALRSFNPCEYLEELGNKTNLVIFKPKQDDVLENKYFEEYKAVPNIKYVEVDGDHNFKDKRKRADLFRQIREFLLS